MSADPIYSGLKEGFSIYGYCRNNPIIYSDPTGLKEKQYDKVNIPDDANALYLNQKNIIGGADNHAGALVKNKKGVWHYISKDQIGENEQFATPIEDMKNKDGTNTWGKDVNKFLSESDRGKKYSDIVAFNLSDEKRDSMIAKAKEVYLNDYWLAGAGGNSNNCGDLVHQVFDTGGIFITDRKKGIGKNEITFSLYGIRPNYNFNPFTNYTPYEVVEYPITFRLFLLGGTSPRDQYNNLMRNYPNAPVIHRMPLRN